MADLFGQQENSFEQSINQYKNNANSVAQGALSGYSSVAEGRQSLQEAGTTAENQIDLGSIQAKMKEEGTKFMKEMGLDFSTPASLAGTSKIFKFAGAKWNEYGKSQYLPKAESMGPTQTGNMGQGTPGQGNLYNTREYGEPGAGDAPAPGVPGANTPGTDDAPPAAADYADVDDYQPPVAADEEPPAEDGEPPEYEAPELPMSKAQPIEDLPQPRIEAPIKAKPVEDFPEPNVADFKGTFGDELPKPGGGGEAAGTDAPPAYEVPTAQAEEKLPGQRLEEGAEPGGLPEYTGGETGPTVQAQPTESLPEPPPDRMNLTNDTEQTISRETATAGQDATRLAGQTQNMESSITGDVDQTIATTTEESSSIAANLAEAGGSFLSGVGGFIGDLMPVLAPIMAGYGMYSGLKDINKQYGAEGNDPYAAVRTQLAAGTAKVSSMGAAISADQFASKVGGAAPAFGSLAAPTFSTAQQMGGATGHF
jgi:hypothetical protein